nr:hypothetical protein BgiMline_031332 [Biomphalaria glabrata]
MKCSCTMINVGAANQAASDSLNKDEPNNFNNNEDCVQYNKDIEQWNDVMCSVSISYLCERTVFYSQ